MKEKKLLRLLPFGALGIALLALLYFSPQVSLAVQDGLTLCYRTIFPSLFPFFVLSTLLISLGFAELSSRVLERPMRVLYRLDGRCAPALLLGFLGGYPVGARTLLSLYQEGSCSKEEAERLLGFCNNCGPAFILSVAGSTVLESRKAGLLLYLIHVLSALCAGLFFRGKSLPRKMPHKAMEKKPDLVSAFVAAVQAAFSSMLSVCSFVVFFTVLLRPLRSFTQSGLLIGFAELFNGICSLQPTKAGFIAAAALIGWGGLSVHAQTLALLCDTDLSLRHYFKGKAIQAILSAALAILTVIFLPWQ
ncbi:MAG: sporulation protein [Oscillospiraceae bacterium]|nr:sporulation protein [Oscillospiraceae bacterium]